MDKPTNGLTHAWNSRSWCGFLFVLIAVVIIACVTKLYEWPLAITLIIAYGLFVVPNAVKQLGHKYLDLKWGKKNGES